MMGSTQQNALSSAIMTVLKISSNLSGDADALNVRMQFVDNPVLS